MLKYTTFKDVHAQNLSMILVSIQRYLQNVKASNGLYGVRREYGFYNCLVSPEFRRFTLRGIEGT